jgi:hypothetical protein
MQFLEITPRIQSSERALHRLLEAQPLPEDLTGEDLILFCRRLWLAADEFAEELVREMLVRRGARSIILVAPPKEFLAQVRWAAKRYDVSDRVTRGLWRNLRSAVPPEVMAQLG